MFEKIFFGEKRKKIVHMKFFKTQTAISSLLMEYTALAILCN